jgi:hypothetical protein
MRSAITLARSPLPACVAALSLAGCGGPAGQVAAYRQSRLASELSDYEAAHVQGRLLDACTKAGQIAAAYREANSPNFVAWDAKRKEDCLAAMARLAPPADRGGPSR